jgi:hypothetical protein
MAIETITTKAGKDIESRTLAVSFDFGDNLETAIEKFGADAVFAGFKADAKVGLQAMVRAKLNATEDDSEALKFTDEEIVTAVAEFKPGTKNRQSADPLAKLMALLGKISPEQRAALLAGAASDAE